MRYQTGNWKLGLPFLRKCHDQNRDWLGGRYQVAYLLADEHNYEAAEKEIENALECVRSYSEPTDSVNEFYERVIAERTDFQVQ